MWLDGDVHNKKYSRIDSHGLISYSGQMMTFNNYDSVSEGVKTGNFCYGPD